MAKIVFMGTPDFAVPTLKSLIAHHDVIGVVTQPDRPAGRKNKIKSSPVKEVAIEAGIPVFQPKRIRNPEAIEELKQWDADFHVVVAFGQILPQAVLDLPRVAPINIHGSLLPRWRGAAPIHAAIRAGDTETGITIMMIDAGLDTGDMLTKRAILIEQDETAQTLHDKLMQIGAKLLIETLPKVLSGEIQPQQQDDSLATYAPQINKEDGRIDWSQPSINIERLVRAFTPWPGTFTFWNGKQLKIHSGINGEGTARHGQVVETDGQIAIGTGDGLYYLQEVQLTGKKRISIKDFANGYSDFVGATLGQ
jgi:methionyl-tRNA formyltransferase